MNTASKYAARRFLPGLFCGLGLVTAGSVMADDVTNAVNTVPLTFGDGATHELIRVVASTPANVATELVITHSFECAVEGNDRVTWFDLDILVDGVVLAPTNNDNASCASTPPDNDVMGLTNWVTTSITVVGRVGGGNHTIIVRGTLRNFTAGERVRVDDQSLVVEEEDAT
ncbi:MAG TPA: hypothetical protein VFO36_05220 [Nitrospiraceae bacterium]|nr:hypothetical protein [Nitrospiraceae bacterium]